MQAFRSLGLRLPHERADVALDFGTATARLHVASRLLPLSRPSRIWRDGRERRALAGGVVVDVEAASAVVADLLGRVRGRWRRPRVLACLPTDATAAERDALIEALLRAGAGAVQLAPEPLAAALGAGLEIETPHVRAVVDIGEGVTDCALVSASGLVSSTALRIGVDDFRQAIRDWIAQTLEVQITPGEAERTLREVGLLARSEPDRALVVSGSPRRGVGPVLMRVDRAALRRVLEPLADRIADHVRRFAAAVPAEGQEALRDAGLSLTGGGALLHGMSERLVGELGLTVERVADPLGAVIEGAHRMRRSEAW